MAKRKTTKITDVPKTVPFSGLIISDKPVPFTPDTLFNRCKMHKKGRPVWLLRPLDNEQRHRLDAEASRIASEATLWASQKGIDITRLDSPPTISEKEKRPSVIKKHEANLAKWTAENVAYTTKMQELEDKNIKREIIRESIAGIKSKIAGFEYEVDELGFLKEEKFDKYHPDLIMEFSAELNRLSALSGVDTTGL